MYNVFLKDGSVVEPLALTFEPHLVIRVADRAAFLALWEKMTPENLEKIMVYENDTYLAGYTNCRLDGIQLVIPEFDGPYDVHLYLSGSIIPVVNAEYKEALDVITGGNY